MDRFTTFKDGWRVLGDGAYMDDALSIRGDAIDRLAGYENTGTEPEEIGDVVMHCKELGLNGLLGLLNAIATDRLIVLPCKVGDTVFVVAYCGEIYTNRDWDTGALECPFEYDCEAEKCDDNSLRVLQTTCTGFCVDELDKKLHVFVKGIGLDSGDVVGERIFLTREEAEAALAKEANNGE